MLPWAIIDSNKNNQGRKILQHEQIWLGQRFHLIKFWIFFQKSKISEQMWSQNNLIWSTATKFFWSFFSLACDSSPQIDQFIVTYDYKWPANRDLFWHVKNICWSQIVCVPVYVCVCERMHAQVCGFDSVCACVCQREREGEMWMVQQPNFHGILIPSRR